MKLRSWIVSLMVLSPIAGCETDSFSGASVTQQMVIAHSTSRPPPASQPDAPVSSAKVRPKIIATVNGYPIDQAVFLDRLISAHGLPVLQQLVLLEAVRQEAQKLGMKVSSADIDAEYELTLQADHMNGKDVEKLTPARREQMIADWVRSRGVSRTELKIAMERQAYLRRMVAPKVQVTEEMVKQEYGRAHGEKVEVRHIQLAALRIWPEVKDRLDKGQRFEELVLLYSQNAISREKLGLMPPFAAGDETVPPVFAKAAFALEAGQYSNPIEAEGAHHILKLERRIPADETPFEAVKDKLRHRLVARRTVQAMQETSSQLLLGSELRIEDRWLREEYHALREAGAITGPPLAP